MNQRSVSPLAGFFRELRLSRNLSHAELSAISGLPAAQLELLEEGRHAEQTSLCDIYAVLNRLHVSDEEFTRFTHLVEASLSPAKQAPANRKAD